MTHQNRVLALALSLGLAACGGSSSSSPPVIDLQPRTQVVALDQQATFRVQATGSGSLSYQWYRNGAALQGATASSWVTAPAAYDDDDAIFWVTVRDGQGNSVRSDSAALRIEGFHDATSMGQARQSFGAVRLPSGKVLVAGGVSGEVLSSTEIYDSATDTFTPTDDLGVGRQNFTMTLLSSGKVLVAGGQGAPGGGTPLASAETFDPATSQYSHAGNMSTARYYHTATPLPGGKVLMVGGLWGPINRPTQLATAEIFDPVTGLFTLATGLMHEARYRHTATLLASGKVLVTGGYGLTGGALDTAEIFDPATGTFEHAGALAEKRYGHTATLLADGTVLLAGGYGTTFLASAEVYDPVAGTFLPTGGMAQARRFHTATCLPDGRVFVAGGLGATAGLESAEIYDPVSATFSSAGSMDDARYYHAAVLLDDGEVLIMGGWSPSDMGMRSAVEYFAAPVLPR